MGILASIKSITMESFVLKMEDEIKMGMFWYSNPIYHIITNLLIKCKKKKLWYYFLDIQNVNDNSRGVNYQERFFPADR